MMYTRSEFLTQAAGAVLGCLLQEGHSPAPSPPRMGIGQHSYGFRHFDDPLSFLEHARSLGAGGIQTALGVRDEAYCDGFRSKLDAGKLYLEGSIALPRKEGEVDRFAQEVRTLKSCGASVFRTVLMGGRRYEVFESAEGFRSFREQAKSALSWIRPVLEKHDVRAAVENHKDLRSGELLELLQAIGCPMIGVCVDIGNNIALLEPPDETVERLAPHAFSTHIKDMGLEEYPDGFLLSEVPLGTGVLDLPGIVAGLRKFRPEIRLNLEMMTRDPLRIPCLTPKYWATASEMPAERLAEMLRWVRAKVSRTPLERVSHLPKEEQLARENENVKLCLKYAEAKLRS
jgi:sugar phosphate isomerase/epimerase